MSSELYLIAHKVRGSAAFDIAKHMECPECTAIGCPECDDLGYWWIIPTSGHRAYPFWNQELRLCVDWAMEEINGNPMVEMPPDLHDHYTTRAAPTISLIEALGLHKPKPQAPILRRL